MTPIDKQQGLTRVLQSLKEQLDLLVKSAFEAKEFSTNEESKAENKYDTRGLEASYLASGQSQRAQKLKEHIFLLEKMEVKKFTKDDTIGMSAIVQLLVGDTSQRTLFLLPVGGVEIELDGNKIQSITIESPIGMNLIDQKVGHEFEINNKFYQVLGVQ